MLSANEPNILLVFVIGRDPSRSKYICHVKTDLRIAHYIQGTMPKTGISKFKIPGCII